ncbi:MAG: MSMEG_4193 family putative phosphomutase [Anaerolineales bacterium]|nr:MSMEG_4193 family putative phosphomutase [Anaerolineales bacterium]
MTTILLIRHAENEYVAKGRLAGRLAGVNLNEKGRQQAQALAEALAKAPLKAIYASPLERCQQTAAPLAMAQDLEVQLREGLLEVDFGEWQDQTLKQLRRRKLWRVVQANPARMRFPGGETFAQAQLRIVQDLEALNQQHDPKDLIACFSHSDLIKLALSYYLGQPLDLFQRIQIAPASVSALHLGEMGAMVLSINHGVQLHWPEQKPKEANKESKAKDV